MSGLRIGLDVGGTNTDAVLLDTSGAVLAWHKTPTTPDVLSGVRTALAPVLSGVQRARVRSVTLGTTHAVNAIVQRRRLTRVGVLRIGAPATSSVPPFTGWPPDLVDVVAGPTALIRGGHDYAGTEVAALDTLAVEQFAHRCADVDAIAVTSVASPTNPDHERRAVAQLRRLLPSCAVTAGSTVGGLGLIERENAAILNGALTFVTAALVRGLGSAFGTAGLRCETYLTQNDGTLLTAEDAARFPVRTIASGPTNSMRGAHHLTGLTEAVVVDVGGTSTDVGLIADGFPRSSTMPNDLGGIRTNYRMPDLFSIGVGGGSVIGVEGADGGYRPVGGVTVGPESVAAALHERGLAFGGDTLTLSDAAARVARSPIGDLPGSDLPVDVDLAHAALALVDTRIRALTDRIRASRDPVPIVVVGGGAGLVDLGTPEVTPVLPEHGVVANAVGAAVAEASGQVDQTFRFDRVGRDRCLADATAMARAAAVRAGAQPDRVRITELTEIPLAYLPGDTVRLVLTAVGPLQSD